MCAAHDRFKPCHEYADEWRYWYEYEQWYVALTAAGYVDEQWHDGHAATE